MKKLLLFMAIAVAANLAVYGQKKVGKRPAAKPKVVKPTTRPTTSPFVREKFDPLRDPKSDLAAAIISAAKENKRIILDVGGEWCGWCVYMDKFFYQNPELAKLRDDNYVWMKVNMSPENENSAFLSTYPEPSGYPHLYVLDDKGNMIHSQDTSPLESGKYYDLAKFTEFLKAWAPKKSTAKH
ncbi:MAG: thioredoxin family protein [Pyrinomonadaceae bacterium]